VSRGLTSHSTLYRSFRERDDNDDDNKDDNDNNRNIDKIIVIIVVSMLVVGPFEKPGLQATFESVR